MRYAPVSSHSFVGFASLLLLLVSCGGGGGGGGEDAARTDAEATDIGSDAPADDGGSTDPDATDSSGSDRDPGGRGPLAHFEMDQSGPACIRATTRRFPWRSFCWLMRSKAASRRAIISGLR